MVPLFALLALLMPCQYEDSLGCTWYATSQGNGAGTSFIALPNGEHLTLGAAR